MASTRQQLAKLLDLMDKLEEDLFDENEKYMYYGGERYTRAEWHNYKRAIEQVRQVFLNNSRTSARYLSKHGDYNNAMRMLCYYRGKKMKKASDYQKIEELEEELTRIKHKYEEERLEKRIQEKDEYNRIKRELNDTDFFEN